MGSGCIVRQACEERVPGIDQDPLRKCSTSSQNLGQKREHDELRARMELAFTIFLRPPTLFKPGK